MGTHPTIKVAIVSTFFLLLLGIRVETQTMTSEASRPLVPLSGNLRVLDQDYNGIAKIKAVIEDESATTI